jgi:hypothetical protein
MGFLGMGAPKFGAVAVETQALVDARHPGGPARDFVDVVGHGDYGDAECFVEVAEEAVYFRACVEVDAAGGFV